MHSIEIIAAAHVGPALSVVCSASAEASCVLGFLFRLEGDVFGAGSAGLPEWGCVLQPSSKLGD